MDAHTDKWLPSAPSFLGMPYGVCKDSFINPTGDKILGMLGDANGLAKDADQLFIVGEGLSSEGTRLLGAQLANMTIGDLEALLHTNKVDPFLIKDIAQDFIELAKALVSKT